MVAKLVCGANNLSLTPYLDSCFAPTVTSQQGVGMPDLTGVINSFIKVLNAVIGVLNFLFRVPILGMIVLLIVGGLYVFYKYSQSKEN